MIKTYELQLNDVQKEKLEKILELIEDDSDIELKEIEEEEDDFPIEGDPYYYIDSVGKTTLPIQYHTNNKKDIERYMIGNVFKTREDAKFEIERLKVIAEMKRFGGSDDVKIYTRESDNRDISSFRYHIMYSQNNLRVCYHYIWEKSADIYFRTKEDALRCIDKVGADRIKKYYLKIKD